MLKYVMGCPFSKREAMSSTGRLKHQGANVWTQLLSKCKELIIMEAKVGSIHVNTWNSFCSCLEEAGKRV